MKSGNIFTRNVKDTSNTDKEEWKSIQKHHRSHFIGNDKIYVYIRDKRITTEPGKKNVVLYIGKGVCEKLSFNAGERVNVMLSNSDPYAIRIIKTTSTEGYKLSGSSATTNLKVSFSTPDDMILNSHATKEIYFEFYESNSIILDISPFRR